MRQQLSQAAVGPGGEFGEDVFEVRPGVVAVELGGFDHSIDGLGRWVGRVLTSKAPTSGRFTYRYQRGYGIGYGFWAKLRTFCVGRQRREPPIPRGLLHRSSDWHQHAAGLKGRSLGFAPEQPSSSG